jgi:hypothetical protein
MFTKTKESRQARAARACLFRGAKERERAARCYMVSAFIGGPPRSAPVMMQMSKRDFYGQPF